VKPAITPLKGFVYAEPVEVSNITGSGLYLPPGASQQAASSLATVLAANEVTGVKKGDQIVYKKYSATTVKLGTSSDEYLLIKGEDVLATVKQ
jgi:co-chaperonin GroES (HSP10)